MSKYPIWQPKEKAEENIPIREKLLLQRNISDEVSVNQFFLDSLSLIQSPSCMKDIDKAVKRILESISRNEKIAIYGDYDVDGVTSLVILAEIFEEMGFINFLTYLPDRENEGYGLNKNALSELAKQGVKLVVTTDCGINAREEALHARNLGLDLIITDHHFVPTEIPDVIAVINPKQPLCLSSFKELSGAGVAWKLGWALLNSKLSKSDLPDLSVEQLDLVSLATVADIVPLVGENRILVKHGLKEMKNSKRPGIKALLEVSLTKPEQIDEKTIGFRLAPRLNASGRLENARTSYNLLKTKEPTKAKELAAELNNYNQKRKTLTEKAVLEALENIDESNLTKALVVKNPDWPTGIIGLVASKLAEKYCRPAIAMSFSQNIWKGSVRSGDFFHVTEALTKLSENLERFGGHAKAAGFSLCDDKLLSFEQAFLALAEKQIEEEFLIPRLKYDSEILQDDLNWTLLKNVEQFAPFGFQNEQPVLVSKGLEIFDLKFIGSQQKHLKIKTILGKSVLDGIGFNFADYFDNNIHLGDKVDIAYFLEANEWNGYKNLQLNILDIKKVG